MKGRFWKFWFNRAETSGLHSNWCESYWKNKASFQTQSSPINYRRMVLRYENWIFPNIMILAVERIIEQRILTCQLDEENDKCSVSSHLVQPNGFCQFTHPFTTLFTFSVIWFPETHYANFEMRRWAYGRLWPRLRELGLLSCFVRFIFFNVTIPLDMSETGWPGRKIFCTIIFSSQLIFDLVAHHSSLSAHPDPGWLLTRHDLSLTFGVEFRQYRLPEFEWT